MEHQITSFSGAVIHGGLAIHQRKGDCLLHQDACHRGKVPGHLSEQLSRRRELEELERQLNQAVAEQRYEDAAALRDRITAKKEAGSHE